MCLVGNIVTQLHLEGRREQLAIGNCGRGIPHLDDMKVPLG